MKSIIIKTRNVQLNGQPNNGCYKITIDDCDHVSLDKLSGCDIPWALFESLALTHESFKEFRERAKALERKFKWNVRTNYGMSGCSDLTLCYDYHGTILNGGNVHISMNDKFHIPEDRPIWVKDLYDIIYWCEHQYVYQGDPEEFTDELILKRVKEFEEIPGDIEIIDLTSYFEQKREGFYDGNFGFQSAAFAANFGYGSEFVASSSDSECQKDYSKCDFSKPFDELSAEEQEAIIYKD
jgi:hypothetical protein